MAMEVPLEVVSEPIGHAFIRVTEDVYGHLMPEAQAEVAEAMLIQYSGSSPPEPP